MIRQLVLVITIKHQVPSTNLAKTTVLTSSAISNTSAVNKNEQLVSPATTAASNENSSLRREWDTKSNSPKPISYASSATGGNKIDGVRFDYTSSTVSREAVATDWE